MANFENQNQLAKEKKTKTNSPNDLPDDLIERIFTFLPIKDAIVIADMVSPQYKKSWRYNRRFLFDENLSERYDQHNLVAIVDHLFNSHKGCEIKTFKLHIDPVGIQFFLNRWLQICAQKDLEDLELHLSQHALVKDISNVSILTTTPLLIEGVTARMRGGVFREAQYCFVNMRELQIFMDWGVFINPYDIMVFLKNCPSLEKLFIDLNDYQFDLGMYWQRHHKYLLDFDNHKFTQLKVVVVRDFKFLPSELELVKIIVQRATILEGLFLIPPKIKGRSKFKSEDIPKYAKNFDSWSASRTLRIKYYENYVEESFANPTHPKAWFIDAS
ncbi:hypothetical protein P8452_15442 [Trifolium repens]|nr:hypothetical protein P8452_15442 [Trifolium repens]